MVVSAPTERSPAFKLLFLFSGLARWSIECVAIVLIDVIREQLAALPLADVNEVDLPRSYSLLVLLALEGIEGVPRVLVAGEGDAVQVELVFDLLADLLQLLGLLKTVLDDLLDVRLHRVLVPARKDYLLRSKLYHLLHLLSTNLIWVPLLVVELAFLHDKMVDLELPRGPFYDLLLDRALGDEPVDNDFALLANPVGSVDGLQVHLRVPVRVEYYHDVGCVQVDPQTSRASREDKELLVRIRPLEVLNALLAFER